VATGVLLLLFALILHFFRFSIDASPPGTISLFHEVCSSAVGQFAQAKSQMFQGRCSQIDLAEHVMGWATGLGLLAIVAGFVALTSQQRRRVN
jgi:hypothetical protein